MILGVLFCDNIFSVGLWFCVDKPRCVNTIVFGLRVGFYNP